MPTGQYSKRTEKNVLDSDGTLIVSHGLLTGGSALTTSFTEQHKKPWLHIDLEITAYSEAARMIREWMGRKRIKILNVAGPRESKDPMIYQAVTELLEATLDEPSRP
jgi:hypothetical protein